MSISQNAGANRNAVAADCARLWRTLTNEYIPGLRLELSLAASPNDVLVLVVEVVDDSAVTEQGVELVNVWAKKEFSNPLYLISVGQLFDLLIVAHRAIDAYFALGNELRPPTRAK